MRQQAPAVFPLFRSRLTAAVLVRVYVGGEEQSVVDLAGAVGVNRGNMAREVSRLERAAVLASRRVGRTKLVRANENAPFYAPLRDLVTITLGPAAVLAEELASVEGIGQADVFGSWAARALGEPGPSPVDIDLLVVGRPDRDDLHDAVRRGRERLGREINIVVVSPERWRSDDDAFLVELRNRPRVPVIEAAE